MPDTLAFLQLLRQLDSPQAEEQQRAGSGGGCDSSSSAVAAADGAESAAAAAEVELPEVRAARGLFRCVTCCHIIMLCLLTQRVQRQGQLSSTCALAACSLRTSC
jgi:hypothetical protein